MWIRSQDTKELINATRIQADRNTIYTFSTIDVENGWIELGRYETDEKAIKVLDDIQYEVINYDPTNNVYIMPEINEKVRGQIKNEK